MNTTASSAAAPRGVGPRAYAEMVVGRPSWPALLVYETITGLLSGLPGGFGMLLRRGGYRWLLEDMGPGVVIGRHVVIRGGARIRIGRGAVIDDGCVLDARGPRGRIVIGENVLLSRHTIVRARDAAIVIGAGSDIGCFCLLATDAGLSIGAKVLIGAYTYLIGGGRHRFDGVGEAVIDQGKDPGRGIAVGDGAWIGARVSVLDGVAIGAGAVIGAHALVTTDIPPRQVAFGAPARIRRARAPA